MYEYIPTYTRKKEKLTFFTLLAVAVTLFCVSRIAGIPFPALWQLMAVCVLTGMVLLVCRFWIRAYTYRVAPREDRTDDIPDLTITERTGGRESVVCRVSLSDIEDATSITPAIKGELKEKRRGKRTWFYYAELSAPNLCQLTVRDGEEIYFVLIQSDEKLFSLLKKM